MRRARLLLPVLAGVLGLVGGVVTAVVVADDAQDSGPGSSSDPLHLGIPLVDLGCTGEALLVVGRGDGTPPLAAAVADNTDLPLRYLRTAESCPTLWAFPSQEAPTYVVYAGPYDAMTEPCRLRMAETNKGDVVTNLTAGNDAFVECSCVLPVAQFPDLTPGLAVDPGNAIWVRSLQRLLTDLDDHREAGGQPGPYFQPRDISGVYDETTEQRIRAFQPTRDISPPEYGSVLAPTWRALVDDTCRLYSF